jgi:hypothetical protein
MLDVIAILGAVAGIVAANVISIFWLAKYLLVYSAHATGQGRSRVNGRLISAIVTGRQGPAALMMGLLFLITSIAVIVLLIALAMPIVSVIRNLQ